MTTDTDRLRADIERTRDEVGQDVNALAEKVDPRKIAERRMESVKDAATSVKDRVMGTAETVEEGVSSAVGSAARMPMAKTRGNPLAVGVIAFGVGWLLASVIPMGEQEKQMAQRALDAAEPLKAEVIQAAADVADGMRDPLKEAAERLGDSATSSADAVKEAVAQVASDSETPSLSPDRVL